MDSQETRRNEEQPERIYKWIARMNGMYEGNTKTDVQPERPCEQDECGDETIGGIECGEPEFKIYSP